MTLAQLYAFCFELPDPGPNKAKSGDAMAIRAAKLKHRDEWIQQHLR